MKPTLCSKCKKNLAVVFITKIENGETINEGYCLKCAKELGINFIDADHYCTENVVVPVLADKLSGRFEDVSFVVSSVHKQTAQFF